MTQYLYYTLIEIPLKKIDEEPNINDIQSKTAGNILIGYRKDSKGIHFIHSKNLEPKTVDEENLIAHLAEKYGFTIDEEPMTYFKYSFDGKKITLDEFQEKVDKIFKAIKEFHDQKKNAKLVSVRIPEWLQKDLKQYGNNKEMADIMRDALIDWRNKNKK
jgi:hypothetical protein